MGNAAKAFLPYACLTLILTLAVFPIFWIFSTSFKAPTEWVARPVVWLPEKPAVTNYGRIFSTPWTGQAMANSALAALGGTALALAVGFPAAYGISRGAGAKGLLFGLTALPRLTPAAVFAIPMLVFYSRLGLVDTLFGLVILYAALTVFFVIWITKPFIDSIPRDLEEAAALEGMSRLGILFRLILPLAKGGLTAAGLFVFVLNWTEFILALTLTMTHARTLPVQLSIFYDSEIGYGLGPVTALNSLSIVPFAVVAYLLQKYLLRGLTFGFYSGRR